MRGEQRAGQSAGPRQPVLAGRAVLDPQHDLELGVRNRFGPHRDRDGQRAGHRRLALQPRAEIDDGRRRQGKALLRRAVALARGRQEPHLGGHGRRRLAAQHAAQLHVVVGAGQAGGIGGRVARSRTASASRSWSPSACTDRGRSPPTAAPRPAGRRRQASPLRSSSSERTVASRVACAPCTRRRSSSSSVSAAQADPAGVRVVVLDRLPPDVDGHPEPDGARPGDQHHLQAARLVRVVDDTVEVQRQRHLAILQGMLGTWPQPPRGRSCRRSARPRWSSR